MKFMMMFVLAWTIVTARPENVCAQSQAASVNGAQNSSETIKLKVKGITCSMDLKQISASVEKLGGVISCEAVKQGPTTTFEVKYNPARVSLKEIIVAIENTGACENPDERPYKVKQ